jgi:pimeloyl-ACP methyl ester carboxylesterase
MNVVLLDPNAWGADYGKDTIEISLNAILRMHSTTTTQFHILAHSAGGGYLVRYLLGHYDRVKERCRKLVFTDSTHNVQWAKHNPDLYQFLQSHSICLYVRNNSESTTDTFSKHKHSAAGEICKGDRFWKQRFGDIPTVWAGTTDHSRMCYEARTIIWDFLRSDDFNNQKIDR